MFERDNINDLFLASIDVTYSNNYPPEINIGGTLQIGNVGYGYTTVLKQYPGTNEYLDLCNIPRIITTGERDPLKTSYTIRNIAPFSKYYNQDREKKKDILSRRKALLKAKKYYEAFRAEYSQMDNEEQTKSL